MIQSGDLLRTWALASEPADERAIAAQALADHRLAYLDYQGPLSDGRGCVARWDAGEYHVVSQQDDSVILALAGGRLQGLVELTRQPDSIDQWTFRFCPGRAATSS
jgi:DNA polymerase Ligase (LigD)